MNSGNHEKSPNMGRLPCPAPLANPYVPFQLEDPPTYSQGKALIRGTLYPGLDLPFMGMVNRCEKRQSPMVQLQQLRFALTELGLYLDTHKDDKQAFEMYQTFLALAKEAHDRYIRKFGPVLKRDMLGMECYAWLDNPWPWDYQPKMEV